MSVILNYVNENQLGLLELGCLWDTPCCNLLMFNPLIFIGVKHCEILLRGLCCRSGPMRQQPTVDYKGRLVNFFEI
jgi:hypothetical protein